MINEKIMAGVTLLLTAVTPALQAEPTAPIITQIITNLGVLGVLVWFMFYTTTKTIPTLNTQYTERMDAAQKYHAEQMERLVSAKNVAIQKMTEEFTQALREERIARKEEIEALKEWISREASCRYNKDHQP